MLAILVSDVSHLVMQHLVMQHLVMQRLLYQTLHAPDQSSLQLFPVAVMFALITGFSGPAEHLAERSNAGVEDLLRLLNRYFVPVIATVNGMGGDMIKFTWRVT